VCAGTSFPVAQSSALTPLTHPLHPHLVVLLHEVLQRALAAVALDKGGCQLNAAVSRLDALRVRTQLGVAGRQVAVQLVRIRVVGGGAPACVVGVVVNSGLVFAWLTQ